MYNMIGLLIVLYLKGFIGLILIFIIYEWD